MSVAKLCRFVPLLALTGLVACGDGDKAKLLNDGGTDATVETDADGHADADIDDDAALPEECPEISFVAPSDGTTLNEADDKDGDRCANGFQYDVSVATSAPDGTPASLFADATLLAETTVSGAVVNFSGVQLTANGESTLRVQVGGVRCLARARVTVACSVPTCSVTKPALSPSHPKLNGVPTANGGDRVSSSGSPYQVAVEVVTSVEDGQPVQLRIDDSEILLTASAKSGKAVFPGVTLVPDGEHSVVATCTGKSGAVGTSARASYEVDTAGPDLTIASPADGAHFELVPSFEVCATSTSADARDLPSEGSATGGKNLCGAIGAASPSCAALATTDQGGTSIGRGCIQIGCPGGPAFDVTVTLRDAAGNSSTKVLSGVTCRTDLPSVEIVSPSSTVPGDPSTRILAANSAQARKDQDPAVGGAQYPVVACSEVENAQVQLKVGLAGGPLANLGPRATTATAAAGDGCPAGKPYSVRFANLTLPESAEAIDGTLLTATRLVAEITDVSTSVGVSQPVDIWVDSQPPTLGAALPAPLCGRFVQSATPWTTQVQLSSSVLPVTLTVSHQDGSQESHTGTAHLTGVFVPIGTFTFEVGVNSLTATTTEPSGNVASLPTPCQVTVGNPPIVSWVEPTESSKLGAGSDQDSSTPGWQGTLKVHTDLAGVAPAPTVQFSSNVGGNIGAAVTVDANGDATLTGATVPEGAAVQLIATTSDVADRGIGRATITVPVDTSVPSGVTGLGASVPEETRRQTTFRLSWTAPADGAQAVTGYHVRVSTSSISEGNFDSAEVVNYVGAPATPGQPDGINVLNRYIERDYYFAVAPVDVAGNRGAIQVVGPTRARFKRAVLVGSGTVGEGYGRSIDGSHSLNGDAYADLIVGSAAGTTVYIYYGAAEGWAETGVSPSVTITGPASFGYSARIIGDIDSDGALDLAVGAPAQNGGTVYVFKGRTTWGPGLGAANADYIISTNPGDPAFSSALLGASLTRLGDFDGDGADDFAIGGYRYGEDRGYVAVIRGVPAGQTFPASIVLGTGSARTIEAIGPSNSQGRSGWAMANLGSFYGTTSVLAVAGHYFGDTLSPAVDIRRGAVFAFSGTVNFASPVDSLLGTVDHRYLGWSIAPLGALGSPMAVAVASPGYTFAGVGSLAIHRGTTATGPFIDNPIVITNAAATEVEDAFGSVFGSVISGVPTSTVDHKSSFLGSPLPDVAISGLAEASAPPKIYLIDGQKVATTLTSGDVADVADVTLTLPSNWVGKIGVMPRSGAIRDLNNDGYADFAVGQYLRLSTQYAGEVLVYW